MTSDCDTADKRGGCPIQTGSIQACTCLCHEGVQAARGFLALVPRFAVEDPVPQPEPEVESATVS